MAEERTPERPGTDARFRLMTESAFDAIITIDSASTIVSWNRGAEHMFGYAADEIVGHSLERVIPERYRARHRSGLERLGQSGVSQVIGTMQEMEALRRDGSSFPVELSVSSWMLDGEAFYSGIVRDISRRRASESRRKARLRHRTEFERHQSLSYMVVGIAHELNTPLGVIFEAATVMANTVAQARELSESGDARAVDAPVFSDLLDASHLIAANAERAMNLVESFKKLSVHQRADDKEEVDIIELIEDSVSLYRLQAEGAREASRLHIEIHEALGEESRLWFGYPSYFTQIINSLLANAEQWAYPGAKGGLVEIAVEALPESARYRITVTDYGVGISKDDMKHIFTPFFTTGRAGGFVGLGLAIVYNLVCSALQGTIRVTARHGIGTRVVIEIPERVEGTDDVTAGILF